VAGAGRDVNALQSRLLGHSPERGIAAIRRGIDEKQARLHSLLASNLTARRARFDAAARQLENLSPEHTLARGYAILVDAEHGTLINRVGLAREHQQLSATLSDGGLDLSVVGKRSR
jgi:exodeoxyribonuclease VII large subunit